MRTLGFALLASFLAAGQARDAFAHGGGGFRGPGGVPPGLREPTDPLPPCRCARPDCPRCSGDHLVDGSELAFRCSTTTVTERWGELVRLRTRIRFRGIPSVSRQEGYVSLERGSLLAVASATFRARGVSAITARRAPSEEARSDYLGERDRFVDPLLILRRTSGRLDLRAFPVVPEGEAVAVVEGFGLADTPSRTPSLYRTEDRFLAVVPLGEASPPADADFVDETGRRALWFLDEAGARERFPHLLPSACAVPCVRELEAAAKDGEEAWVAVPTSVPMPPTLRAAVAPPPPPPPLEPRSTVETVARP